MDTIVYDRYKAMMPDKKIETVDDAISFIDKLCNEAPDVAIKLPLPPRIVTKNKAKLRTALRELNKQRESMNLPPHKLIDQWESEFVIAIADKSTTERQRQELGIWREIKFKVEEVDGEEWKGPDVSTILAENLTLPPLKFIKEEEEEEEEKKPEDI